MLVVLVLLAAQADAGVTDGGTPPTLCGTLTDEGACFNTVAAFCSVENSAGQSPSASVVEQACPGACAVLDGVGAWCFAPDGARCAFEAGARATTFACGPPAAAPDPSYACDVVDGCVAVAVGGCGAGCAAPDRLRIGCAAFGQAVTVACGAFGGSCDGSACQGLGAGAPCDDVRLFCAPGGTCLEGTCVVDTPGVRVDAGPADPPPPPAPPPLCGAGPAAAPLALALTALAGLRRRRSRPDRTG